MIDTTSVHTRRRLLIEVLLLGALALGTRLVQLDHTPYYDELFHVLAAEALVQSGTLEIPGGTAYENKPTRHDPSKLALVIAGAYRDHRGNRRRLPHRWQGLPGLSTAIGSGDQSNGAAQGSP